MARICVVDDNEMLRESVSEALTREDHLVTVFADPVEALKAIQATSFDCVVSDLKMPGMTQERGSAGAGPGVVPNTSRSVSTGGVSEKTEKTSNEATFEAKVDVTQTTTEAPRHAKA